ncbi:hypothetical protein AAHE18_11G038000 [Arachis hypogaea]
MGKFKIIHTFFKRKYQGNEDDSTITTPIFEGSSNFITSSSPLNSSKRLRLLPSQLDVFHLERDLGMRPMIWKFPPNQRDEIRLAYINVGLNQSILDNYLFSGDKNHRRFQASWFKLFPSWLEYSIEDDAIYCFPCFLFAKEPSINTGSNALIENGLRNWKKANSEKECALLNHIDKGYAYRGHDESQSSSNRGNFLKMLKFLGSYNERVKKNVLENAPKNVKYTSNEVRKEILHILATKVRNSIREKIGDAKFCIIVDETRDKSKKEQMSIVLRFVTLDNFVKERFFDLVHVTDTCAITLKKEVIYIISHYNLQVENIRGQAYDDASNMRDEWNGLQALFLKDSPQAYYVHCFAHRLQLALVAASREVLQIYEFFIQLKSIITIVISTLQRVGDTRWSSHFNSICSLVKMFTATNIVLNNIIEDGTTYVQRGEAYGVKIMKITNDLCQALQQ